MTRNLEVKEELKEIGKRFRRIRKHFNLTQRKMAEITGISITNIWGIETGRMKLTRRVIMAVVNVFNINEVWLEKGTGDMLLDKGVEYEEILKVYNQMSPNMQKFFINYGRFLLKNSDFVVKEKD